MRITSLLKFISTSIVVDCIKDYILSREKAICKEHNILSDSSSTVWYYRLVLCLNAASIVDYATWEQSHRWKAVSIAYLCNQISVSSSLELPFDKSDVNMPEWLINYNGINSILSRFILLNSPNIKLNSILINFVWIIISNKLVCWWELIFIFSEEFPTTFFLCAVYMTNKSNQ